MLFRRRGLTAKLIALRVSRPCSSPPNTHPPTHTIRDAPVYLLVVQFIIKSFPGMQTTHVQDNIFDFESFRMTKTFSFISKVHRTAAREDDAHIAANKAGFLPSFLPKTGRSKNKCKTKIYIAFFRGARNIVCVGGRR